MVDLRDADAAVGLRKGRAVARGGPMRVVCGARADAERLRAQEPCRICVSTSVSTCAFTDAFTRPSPPANSLRTGNLTGNPQKGALMFLFLFGGPATFSGRRRAIAGFREARQVECTPQGAELWAEKNT